MVTRAGYVPDRGDLVWLEFDPCRERARRRPALVLSPRAYNQATGLALMGPVTSRQKGYPFESPLPKGSRISGVVLSDHIKSLDWRARRAEFGSKARAIIVSDVLGKLGALLS